MQISETFYLRVEEKVLDGNIQLNEQPDKEGAVILASMSAVLDKNGDLTTDHTRRNLIALLEATEGNMTPVIEELLRMEVRLSKYLKIFDPQGEVRGFLAKPELKDLFGKHDPAKIFDQINRIAPEGSSLALKAAERLGMGQSVILRSALEQAAEENQCAAEIKALMDEVYPRIEAEIAEEMEMTYAERMLRKGF